MSAKNRRNKKAQSGGPQQHPTNHGPSKPGGNREGVRARGGNKVSQGKGADTGNKGKA